MKVIKRNGTEVEFDAGKIANAITKANESVNEQARISKSLIKLISEEIEEECKESGRHFNVEEIQDMVEYKLIRYGAAVVARSYIKYRYKRDLVRKANTTDQTIFELVSGTSEYWNTENSNKNAREVTTQRDYIAGVTSTDIARRFIFPEKVVKAHDEGLIHIHDMDYVAQNALHNCCLINLNDMLQYGTVINGVMIEKPHKFLTACTIATQIILGVSSSQYGGATVSLTHLAPFVRSSYEAYLKKYKEEGFDEKTVERLAKKRTQEEIEAGVQTFNYQVNSMTNTNGQAPFLSVVMYLGETVEYKEELAMIIEEFLKQRILGFKNEKGVYITPAFPKLLYFLEEDNIREDSKYWYLTKLAAKCSAKRLTPDYISAKVMQELKGDVYGCMGCRSFLTPDRFTDAGSGNIAKAKDYIPGEHKYYGRFNCGVVTISLPDIACSSDGDMEKFWEIFDERLELCHDALKVRYERLDGIIADAAPILWRHGALARLEKGESIKNLVHNGYATISLGYAGLHECVKRMTGKSHTDPEAFPFAQKVMQYMNDACTKWKQEENIDYSVYGTPLESTTYKFAKSLQDRFGVIEGVSDRNFITNSYHIHVEEEINAFEKLAFEAKLQKLSPGGAVSYVEVPNLENNLDAVVSLIKFMYDNIMYAEINTKSDYCQECGYTGEIQIVKDNGKLVWECPNCKNRDQTKLNVARRTCGYIGTQFWNQGRTEEIAQRVLHL